MANRFDAYFNDDAAPASGNSARQNRFDKYYPDETPASGGLGIGSNPVTNLGKGLVRGVTHGLPKQLAQASQQLGIGGREPGDFAQELVERGNKAEEEAGAPGMFEQAGEMIPSSIGIPAALYGAGLIARAIPTVPTQIASPILMGAGKVAGLVTPAVFGLSQAEQTRSEAIKRGVDPGSAPLKTGTIEWLGETVGNYALLKAFGPLGGIAKSIIGQTGAKQALKGTVLGFLKQFALVTAPTEILTEMGQNYGEALVEKHAGIRPEANPWNEAVSAIGPTAIMTALVGGGGQMLQRYAAAKAADTLATPVDGYDPNNLTPEAEARYKLRLAYAKNVSEVIPKENEALRQQWLAYAQSKIDKNLEIDITSPMDSLAMQTDMLMDTMPEERAAIESVNIPAAITGAGAERVSIPGEKQIIDEGEIEEGLAAADASATEKLLAAIRGDAAITPEVVNEKVEEAPGTVIPAVAPKVVAAENAIENVTPSVNNVAPEASVIATDNAIAPENVANIVKENVTENVMAPAIEAAPPHAGIPAVFTGMSNANLLEFLNNNPTNTWAKKEFELRQAEGTLAAAPAETPPAKPAEAPIPKAKKVVKEKIAAAAPAVPAAVAAPVAAGVPSAPAVTPASTPEATPVAAPTAPGPALIKTKGNVVNQKTNVVSNERPISLFINENGVVKIGDSVALLERNKNGKITATWETTGQIPRNTKKGSTVAATKQIHKAFLTETPELTKLVGPAPAKVKTATDGKALIAVKKATKIATPKAAAPSVPAAAIPAAGPTTTKGKGATALKEVIAAKKEAAPVISARQNQIIQLEKSVGERARTIQAMEKQGKSTVAIQKAQSVQQGLLNKLRKEEEAAKRAEIKAKVAKEVEPLSNQEEVDELQDSIKLLNKQLKDAVRAYDESVRLERPERQQKLLAQTRDDIKKELDEVNRELKKITSKPSFTRAETAEGGVAVARAQAVVDKVLSYLKNPPKVQVLESINSFINSEDPMGKQLKAYMVEHDMLDENGEDNRTLGFTWEGQTYIIASNNKSPQQVVNTLTHELTHLGLGTFLSNQKGVPGIGSTKIKYDILMDKVYAAHSEQVNLIAKTTHQHLNVETTEGRRKAAEEWLCDQAYETQPKWYDKLIAIFHEAMRKIGIDTKLSDAEVRIVLQNAFREFSDKVDSPLFARSAGYENRNYGAKILAGEERTPSNVAPLLSDVATHLETVSRKDGRIDHRSATKMQKEHIVTAIKEMLRASIKRYPESLGWYRKDLETTMSILQDIYPELKNQSNKFRMKLAIALSSNGNDTTTNIEVARKIYESFKSTKTMASEVKAERGAAILKSLMLADRLSASFKSDAAFEKWLLGKSYVGDLYNDVAERLGVSHDAAKKLIGGSENVDTMLPRAIVFGPKVGAFFTNLSGDFSQITMDRWFTRTMGRLMGHLVEGGSRQEVETQRANLVEAMGNSPEGLRLCQIQGDLFPGPKNVDEVAKKIAKLCGKEDFRDELNSVPGGEALRIAANNRKKFINGALPIDSPSSGAHRQWFRDRVNEAREDLEKEGVNYENADIQAAIWIGEKELYKLFGVKGKRGDYYSTGAEALHVKLRRGPSGRVAGIAGRVVGRSGASASQTVPLFSRAPNSSIIEKIKDIALNSPDGFTINVSDGTSQKTGYAVAPSKFTETRVNTLTRENLTAFIDRFGKVFESDDRAFLGGWFDGKTNQFVLDVSFVLDKLSDALYIGDIGQQDAIFHLDNFEEIGRQDGINKLKEAGLYSQSARDELRAIQESLHRAIRESGIAIPGERGEPSFSRAAGRTRPAGQQPVRKGFDRVSGRARIDAGTHYSKQERTSLDSKFYGTGLSDATSLRLPMDPKSPLRHRIYFYYNTGNGMPNPERGVGAFKHDVDLSQYNIYDLTSNVIKITPVMGENVANTLEMAILKAGFDGFSNPNYGIAVLLGKRTVPVQPVKEAPKFDRAAGAAIPPGNGATWNAPVKSLMNKFWYTMVDKHVDLRDVTTSIEKFAGAISDTVNASLKETLFSGRVAKRVENFLDGELKPVLKDLAAANIDLSDFEEYLHYRHAKEANDYVKTLTNDKGEVIGMQDGGSGKTYEQIKNYNAALDPALKNKMEPIAEKVDAMTRENARLMVEYSLESQDTIDKWFGTYQHYVPLFRQHVAEARIGTGSGLTVTGSITRKRKGSPKPVVNVLANIANQRERVISSGEKNIIATALYGLAKAHPNPEFWSIVKPGVRKRLNVATGEMVWTPDDDYKKKNNVVMSRQLDDDGKIVERGVEFSLENDRARRMADSIRNIDMDTLGLVLSTSAKVTRFIASMNTQYNPIFGVTNFVRDVGTAMFNLTTTPIAGHQKEVMSHAIPALMGIYSVVRSGRAGRPATGEWARLFNEFQEHGGQTGYRDLFRTTDERSRRLEREIRMMQSGKAIKLGMGMFNWLSDYNTAMENSIRLSAYKVGIDRGMTKDQAAAMAKGLTVNFNRKGQIATQAGALYAFFNASAQGAAKVYETLTGPTGKRIIAGGLLFGVMQAAILAAAGMDEDEPPEFVQEKNIIIPISGGKYITIPMPLGFNVLPNIGRMTAQFAMGGFKQPFKKMSNLFGVILDGFNPLGASKTLLQTISPTPIDPLVALAENKDWTGKPIYREDFSSLHPTPGFTRTKDTATWGGKALSWGLNMLTGGTRATPGFFSPTPDQIDYLVGQATGGVGREAAKIQQGISAISAGEEIPSYKIPLASRFFGSTVGKSYEGTKYYENLKLMNKHEDEIKDLREHRESTAEYYADNPEAKLWRVANRSESSISKLNQRKREMQARGASPASIKAIDAMIYSHMIRLNKAVEEARE